MPPKNLAERIRNADRNFHLLITDFIDEILKFHYNQDSPGIRDLLNALKLWHLDNGDIGENEAKNFALSTLDYICKTADVFLNMQASFNMQNSDTAIRLSALLEDIIRLSTLLEDIYSGPVRSFYRNSVRYYPFYPGFN